jgi:hypothetical protein
MRACSRVGLAEVPRHYAGTNSARAHCERLGIVWAPGKWVGSLVDDMGRKVVWMRHCIADSVSTAEAAIPGQIRLKQSVSLLASTTTSEARCGHRCSLDLEPTHKLLSLSAIASLPLSRYRGRSITGNLDLSFNFTSSSSPFDLR